VTSGGTALKPFNTGGRRSGATRRWISPRTQAEGRP
jgi:hypothetical protein